MINFLDIWQEKIAKKWKGRVLKFGMHFDVWNVSIQLTDSLEIIYKEVWTCVLCNRKNGSVLSRVLGQFD